MRVTFNDFQREYHSIKDEIDEAIAKVLSGGSYIDGPIVREFEDRFAAYCGTEYCVGCGNGTDALEIILEALEIGPGAEVLVPACSWISTSEVVTRRGAKPVFVDILSEHYTIDPDRIEEKISPATRAILPVHLYGLPAEMDVIMDIAEAHGLHVIEDCAHAHGALYRGHPVGRFGIASAFSFYPTKNLGAYGDGGAMVTSSKDLSERLRMLANHGQSKRDDHRMEGSNSRLDTLQAAVLLVKLKKLSIWNQQRQKNARIYHKVLAGMVPLPEAPPGSEHVYHLYVTRVKDRSTVRAELDKAGIQTMIHYPSPLPFLPPYQRFNLSDSDFPVAASHQDHLISLPINPFLLEEEVSYVGECMKRIIAGLSSG